MDVTSSATFETSSPAVATLTTNANNVVSNRIRPSALGATTISATLGSRTVTASVNVVSSTAISSITLQSRFDDDGVSPSDPSISECSRTFRGDIGISSELVATFNFADNDALVCPVTIPIGSLSRSTIQDDYMTLGSVLNNLVSDRTQSVAVVAPDWAPPHPSGFDLLLQTSAPDAVTLTATSTCVAAGEPPLLAHAFLTRPLQCLPSDCWSSHDLPPYSCYILRCDASFFV